MNLKKNLIRLTALCLLVYGAFLVLGSILYGIDVLNKVEKVKPLYFLHPPYYVLLIISSIGLLRTKKWGIQLLFVLLLLKIVYLFVTGYYQGLFNVILKHADNYVEYALGFIVFFRNTFLAPSLLFIFFSLPKIRAKFK